MWELDLTDLYPPLMKTILLTIAILIILNFDSIIKPFRAIKKRTWLILFLIFLCGLYIRLFVILHTHQVYFDEFEHVNIAENILYSNRFCECFVGSTQNCLSCELMAWPPGYHTVLSLVLGVFGDSEAVAFNTNAVLGSLSIILMFLLIFLIFNDSTLALLGSFILSFIPVHLRYSGTTSMEILSFFFVVLSMIFLEIYFRTRKTLTFTLFLATLLYAMQTRSESFLLLVPFSIYILLRDSKELKQFLKKEYLIPILLFLLLLIPLIQLLYYGTSVSHTAGYDDPIPQRIAYLQQYLIPNILFFFDNNFNSSLFSLICIVGAAQLFLTDTKRFLYYSSFFFILLLAYSSFSLGNIDTYDSVRYSLTLYIPLVIFIVAGIDFILKIPFNKNILIFIIVLVYLITLLPTQNFIFSKNEFVSEYEFILSMKGRLPSDIYIVTFNPPSIMTSLHQNAILARYFIANWNTSEPKNNVILFEDYWWYENSNESSTIEEELKKNYNFTLIAESPEGYAFYNLTLK